MTFDGKILHLPIETAGQIATISRAQRELGFDSISVSYHKHPFDYAVDKIIDIRRLRKKRLHVPRQLIFMASALQRFDIFHFHFGMSFLEKNKDLPFLRRLKKKTLMHFWGSDARTLTIASKKNKYVRLKETQSEESIRRQLSNLARDIPVAIVADYELREYIEGLFDRIEMVRQAIDLERYSPEYPAEKEGPLKIVHAPSHSFVKGTDFIEPVIKELKEKFKIDFVLVQNRSHREALEIYRKADIIIDQILLGAYGIFAIEAMALGKPVMCYIREDLVETYPAELPILSTNPDNLEANLERLCGNAQLRADLGRKGRQYVEEYHDSQKIAMSLIELYGEM